jgi:hypothetical protein
VLPADARRNVLFTVRDKRNIIAERGDRTANPIELPKKLKKPGWKVKVYSRERLEPPHLTLICRAKVWRIGLRDSAFMIPPGGGWRDIDPSIRAIIEENWQILCDAWDEQHPRNRVSSEEEDDA